MQKIEISGLDSPKVWDIELAYQHLKRLGEASTKRTAVRRLHEWNILPNELQYPDLKDHDGRSPIPSVLNWEIEEARSKRKLILFVQLSKLPNETNCLHANDPRGTRYWIPFSHALEPQSLVLLLQKLQKHLNKPIVLFPHGKLTSYFHQIQNIPANIDVSLLSYPPCINLNTDFLPPQLKKITNVKAINHLDRLEAEGIHIIREAVAEAENPVMLYSIGKDSAVMLHLARKAFFPATPPFPLLHVDTRWKFQEMYLFREAVCEKTGMKLLSYTNPEAIRKNINPIEHGSALHTDITKTQGLKQALIQHQFDIVFGGARRDEEKSRAKERIFSFRTASHRWDPKNQRPEVWNLYNTHIHKGENIRVFPLSNWTELDIWQYIYKENIPVVPLYFAKERPIIERNGLILMIDDHRMPILPKETIQRRKIRFRTLGCYPLTGAIESNAETVPEIILELFNSPYSERQGRAIDTDTNASMEQKKQEGYF